MTSDASITIAAVSPRDVSQIMPVMTQAFDPAYGEAWTLPQCLGIMSMPGAWLIVARGQSEAVGFAMGRTIVAEAELLLLAVAPSAQRSGIGRAVMQTLIDQLRTGGVSKLHLEVRSSNSAHTFYKDLGFVGVGLRKNYYRGATGALADALTLTRDIR